MWMRTLQLSCCTLPKPHLYVSSQVASFTQFRQQIHILGVFAAVNQLCNA